MRKPMKIYLAVLVPLLILDWVTKAWVRANMAQREAIDVIPGFFRLWHRVNKGAAWSMFGDQSWGMTFLIIVGFVALGAMVWIVHGLTDREKWTAAALGAMASGAAGNLLDRIRFQQVTDFLDVYAESGPLNSLFTTIAGSSHYPTFNVADIAIVVGAIIMVILAIRGEDKAAQKGAGKGAEAAGSDAAEPAQAARSAT